MGTSFLYKHAGLITIYGRSRWAFHLFPKRSCWYWGINIGPAENGYDFNFFGLGPLALLVLMESDS